MTIGPITKIDSEMPWGKPNARRGANHEDKARAFVKAFPVGTRLTTGDFDQWSHDSGFLVLPPGDADKQSDAWKAHLQRRHELKKNLVLAGTHPRMDSPFTIEAFGSDVWEVRSPQSAIGKTKMFAQLESLVKHKRKSLGYLMQSADWAALPPTDRAFAEALFDDIDMFQEAIDLDMRNLTKKFDKLALRIQRAVERGDIAPRNGGIKGLFGPPAAE